MEDPSRKRKILEKMENNLSISIKHNDSEAKILKAVEKVREAKLSLFKGQREISKYQEISDNEKLAENISHHLQNIEKNIKLWESLSNNEIIKLYSGENV